MATKALMAELTTPDVVPGLPESDVESVGGVNAEERIRTGEAVDLVVLSAAPMDRLRGEGLVSDVTPLFRSEVVIGVPSDAPLPDVTTLESLQQTLAAAPAIGHSTGPSGKDFVALMGRWGLAAGATGRLVEAPAGVPVASLIADGTVAIGVQQRSELEGVPGVTVLPLPDGARISSVFTGAVPRAARRPGPARAFLGLLHDSDLEAIVRRHGMAPA